MNRNDVEKCETLQIKLKKAESQNIIREVCMQIYDQHISTTFQIDKILNINIV